MNEEQLSKAHCRALIEQLDREKADFMKCVDLLSQYADAFERTADKVTDEEAAEVLRAGCNGMREAAIIVRSGEVTLNHMKNAAIAFESICQK